jgi:hypothetical protein
MSLESSSYILSVVGYTVCRQTCVDPATRHFGFNGAESQPERRVVCNLILKPMKNVFCIFYAGPTRGDRMSVCWSGPGRWWPELLQFPNFPILIVGQMETELDASLRHVIPEKCLTVSLHCSCRAADGTADIFPSCLSLSRIT